MGLLHFIGFNSCLYLDMGLESLSMVVVFKKSKYILSCILLFILVVGWFGGGGGRVHKIGLVKIFNNFS